MNIEVRHKTVELGELEVGDLFQYDDRIYLLDKKKNDTDKFVDVIWFCSLGKTPGNYNFLSEETSFDLRTKVVPVKIKSIEFYYKAHSIEPPYTKKISDLPEWSLFEYNGFIYLLTLADESEDIYDCFSLSSILDGSSVEKKTFWKGNTEIRPVEIHEVSFIYK